MYENVPDDQIINMPLKTWNCKWTQCSIQVSMQSIRLYSKTSLLIMFRLVSLSFFNVLDLWNSTFIFNLYVNAYVERGGVRWGVYSYYYFFVHRKYKFMPNKKRHEQILHSDYVMTWWTNTFLTECCVCN